MFILLIDVDDDTRSVVFNDLSLHDTSHIILYCSRLAPLFTVICTRDCPLVGHVGSA
jgi:hypothetical protein